ncbi:MAG: tetratricopeptide repeat protein [Longimicrobiales bacterium]
MATPFLSAEEYDERAHKLYNDGDYDAALETLKEGIRLYPNSVELFVGFGYARLAREEYAWAREAFEKALVLDPEHEDALVGLGEVLLRFGRHKDALGLFDRVRQLVADDDLELLLSIGRALYREEMFEEAREAFAEAATVRPDSAEAAAALGYTLHRLAETNAARRLLRRALKLDGSHHEARIYLGHLHYDRGEWELALEQYEAVPPADHWDPVAIWRLLELKRALHGAGGEAPELKGWAERLDQLENVDDATEALLAEIEQRAAEPSQLELFERDPESVPTQLVHQVRGEGGRVFAGTWLDIVRQMRDAAGRPDETIAEYMRREARDAQRRGQRRVPADDPESFLLALARAGVLKIDR